MKPKLNIFRHSREAPKDLRHICTKSYASVRVENEFCHRTQLCYRASFDTSPVNIYQSGSPSLPPCSMFKIKNQLTWMFKLPYKGRSRDLRYLEKDSIPYGNYIQPLSNHHFNGYVNQQERVSLWKLKI